MAQKNWQPAGILMFETFLAGILFQQISDNSMAIRTTTNGENHELLVSGRVDGDAANQLELEILNAIRGGANRIYVNMAEVNFLCSAGIRVLLQYWRQMKNSGKTLQVASPSAEVNSVLETTGFRNMIVEGAQPAS